jgi:hypothetical protein
MKLTFEPRPRLSRRTCVSAALASVVASSLLITWVAGSAAAPAAPGDPEDPATTPQPQYDYDNDDKSFVVDLQFGASSATLVDATVGTEPSYSHLGDPALLRLSLTDEDGNAAGAVNSFDPRWYYEEAPGGGERVVIRPGPGTLTLPFDPDAASLLVRDQRAGVDLATVDLGPAIQEFCVAHPSDPDCVEADLAVTSSAATGAPMGVVGQSTTVNVSTVVANRGPDGPVDGDVHQTAVGSAGVTVTPGSRDLDADGLAAGGSSTVTSSYQVKCTAAGPQTVTVTSVVSPEKAKVVDPVASNNTKATTFAIDCAVPVTLNVLPGVRNNPVFVNGPIALPPLLPIAVLTTKAGEYGNPLAFDATKIQGSTVRVGVRDALVATNTGTPPLLNAVVPAWSLEPNEHTIDLDLDGVLKATTHHIGIQPSTTEVCVRGRFTSGSGPAKTFFGCDHITQLP